MFFPRVVSNQMIEAGEPVLTISPLFSNVRLNTTSNTIDYYAMGALQAHEIPEGSEYPEEKAVWAKAARTAKVTKKGLKMPITQELIDDDLFDVIAIYIRAGGRAMARYKEKLAVQRFLAAAADTDAILFDNDDAGVANTTGRGYDGAYNNSIDGHDLIDMFAAMLASGRTPTHVIMHPLAWTMFADDPIVRNLSLFAGVPGPAPKNVYSGGTPADGFYRDFLNKSIPFGIQVLTSPFVPFTPKSGNTPAKTDLFVVDANDLGVITTREELTTDQWNDASRDIVAMKVKERYDITVLDSEGINVSVAKNISVARNYGNDVTFMGTLQ
jgi:hypothetical protein